MRKWWAKITGLVVMAILLLPEIVAGRRAEGGAPGDRGRHPEVYRLGGLVDQPV